MEGMNNSSSAEQEDILTADVSRDAEGFERSTRIMPNGAVEYFSDKEFRAALAGNENEDLNNI